MRRLVLLLAMLLAAGLMVVSLGSAQESSPATGPLGSTEPPTPTEPPPDLPPVLVPDGVTISGIEVGGLTVEQARVAVETTFAQPLELVHRGIRWLAPPDRLGAKAYVDGALSRALTSPPGAEVDLLVTVRGQAVRDYLAQIDRRVSRKAKDAKLRLVNLKPRIAEARPGVQLERNPTVAAIVHALRTHERGPIGLVTSTIKPHVTAASFGSVVVIRRETKRLFLYRGEKQARTFRIATGQASYPTPLGRFTIVTKQRNPWWYPPASPWAEGAKPVPPGPGNPLGTRWMGLSAPLVGIHGTPDSASIGYSASHGCIRMLVSEAEWLFDHVRLGTTVFIVRA
jgi:lipoprotein-anchoring transpeptidase ErfK/SrfK